MWYGVRSHAKFAHQFARRLQPFRSPHRCVFGALRLAAAYNASRPPRYQHWRVLPATFQSLRWGLWKWLTLITGVTKTHKPYRTIARGVQVACDPGRKGEKRVILREGECHLGKSALEL